MITQNEAQICIVEHLDHIEKENQVKILYACEAGSRAWGFDSLDSDYDIRFVYISLLDRYLTLDKQRDVIEVQGPVFDLVGWDIRKALYLFRKTNPNFIEWLYSPIVYRNIDHRDINLRQTLIGYLRQRIFGKKAIMSHYLGMAERNWKEYLQGESVWTKKYLYVIRPILACIWIESEDTPPPVLFDSLFDACKQHITDGRFDETLMEGIITGIDDLISRKKAGAELDYGPSIPALHDFISIEKAHFHLKISKMGPVPRDQSTRLTVILETLFSHLLGL